MYFKILISLEIYTIDPRESKRFELLYFPMYVQPQWAWLYIIVMYTKMVIERRVLAAKAKAKPTRRRKPTHKTNLGIVSEEDV